MPRPTRLLHIINDLRVGGAERLLSDLLPRLRSAGFDVSAATLGVSDSYLQRQVTEGGEGQAAVGLHLPDSGTAIRSPRHIFRLRNLLKEADIVHVHLFPAQLWVALAAALLPESSRPRLITTEHNTTNGRRGNPVLRLIDRWMYGRYQRIVAVSDATSKALAEWVPNVRDRLTVIPNAVDTARFASAIPVDRRELLGVGEEAFMVACTGRFEPQKDQATLVRALALLPAHIHVAFLGDGPLRAEAERLVVSLGLQDRAHFLGIRSDVPGVLKACNAYAQPSLWEGFVVSAVEAMAAGLPIVVSDVPGMSEVVGNEAGFSFPPGDCSALAAVLARLAGDPAEAGRQGIASRKRATRFGFDRYLAAHVALYDSL